MTAKVIDIPNKLLPCPFCGAPGRIPIDSAAVYCSNIDRDFFPAPGRCLVGPGVTAMTVEKAVAKWNKRPENYVAAASALSSQQHSTGE